MGPENQTKVPQKSNSTLNPQFIALAYLCLFKTGVSMTWALPSRWDLKVFTSMMKIYASTTVPGSPHPLWVLGTDWTQSSGVYGKHLYQLSYLPNPTWFSIPFWYTVSRLHQCNKVPRVISLIREKVYYEKEKERRREERKRERGGGGEGGRDSHYLEVPLFVSEVSLQWSST